MEKEKKELSLWAGRLEKSFNENVAPVVAPDGGLTIEFAPDLLKAGVPVLRIHRGWMVEQVMFTFASGMTGEAFQDAVYRTLYRVVEEACEKRAAETREKEAGSGGEEEGYDGE